MRLQFTYQQPLWQIVKLNSNNDWGFNSHINNLSDRVLNLTLTMRLQFTYQQPLCQIVKLNSNNDWGFNSHINNLSVRLLNLTLTMIEASIHISTTSLSDHLKWHLACQKAGIDIRRHIVIWAKIRTRNLSCIAGYALWPIWYYIFPTFVGASDVISIILLIC